MELIEGAPLDLIRPPQGGHVVFIGARATGVCANNTTLRGELYFPDDTFISREGRPLNFEPIAAMPGWGRPSYHDIAGLANVPVCGNNTGRVLLGETLEVAVEIEDRDGVTVSRRINATLRCAQEDAGCRSLCECECDPAYDIAVGCDIPEGTACEL